MTERQTQKADQSHDNPKRTPHPLSGIRGKMAGLGLALGLGASACEPSQTTDKPTVEFRDDQKVLQDAKEGHLSMEDLQVEIDLQLADGNISEYYARKLTEKAEEMDLLLHNKKVNLKHSQDFGSSYPHRDLLKNADPGKEHEDWSHHQKAKKEDWGYGMSEKTSEREAELENPTGYARILSMMELNNKIQEEIKKQIEEGLITQEEATESVTPYTLISEHSWKWDNRGSEQAVTRQEGRSELEKALNLAKNYLKMNRERKARILDQLEKGLINQGQSDNLMQEPPGRAIYQLRKNEIKVWTEEGFITPAQAKIVREDLTVRAAFFRALEKVKKEIEEARKSNAASELERLEKEKKGIFRKMLMDSLGGIFR